MSDKTEWVNYSYPDSRPKPFTLVEVKTTGNRTEVRRLTKHFVAFPYYVKAWRYIDPPTEPILADNVDRVFIEHLGNLGHLKSAKEKLEELKNSNICAGKLSKALALQWVDEAIKELDRKDQQVKELRYDLGEDVNV